MPNSQLYPWKLYLYNRPESEPTKENNHFQKLKQWYLQSNATETGLEPKHEIEPIIQTYSHSPDSRVKKLKFAKKKFI